MPHYFFDIYDEGRRMVDESGTELPSLRAACAQAIAVLPAIAKDELPHQASRDLVAHVRDRTGRVVFQAYLSLRSGSVDSGNVWPMLVPTQRR